MIKVSKILLGVVVLICAMHTAFADRGIGKKGKSKLSLNISTSTTLKNSLSMNFNSGLTYTGSYFLNNSSTVVNNSMMTNTLVTYQKGNTVYIVPYKQRVIIPVPDSRQGYSGVKLIITPRH